MHHESLREAVIHYFSICRQIILRFAKIMPGVLSIFLASLLSTATCALKFSIPNIKLGHGAKNGLELSINTREINLDLKKSVLSLAIIPLLLASTSVSVHAEESKDVQKYYWGVGCFWHTQHEFIEAERRILGRTDEQLTVVKSN